MIKTRFSRLSSTIPLKWPPSLNCNFPGSVSCRSTCPLLATVSTKSIAQTAGPPKRQSQSRCCHSIKGSARDSSLWLWSQLSITQIVLRLCDSPPTSLTFAKLKRRLFQNSYSACCRASPCAQTSFLLFVRLVTYIYIKVSLMISRGGNSRLAVD